MNILTRTALTLALVAAAGFTPVYAQQHKTASAPQRTMSGPMHLDQRYQHDHYYPARGFSMKTLPSRSVSVPHGQANWFYHGGVWFRPSGGRYLVDAPPFGIIVPFLPPAYVSLWIGDVPYYYANGVYYTSVADGYTVVAPPPGADAAAPVAPTFFIYSRNGQSTQQTEADRAACNDWAAVQPGTVNDSPAFQRAFAACMDGRGYSVK